MTRSPDKPWQLGRGDEYTSFQLELNVCEDKDGQVWSDHDYKGSVHQIAAESLTNGGQPQIAHALLTEAVRREAFVCVLVEMTKDPTFLSRWTAGSATDSEAIEAELGKIVSELMAKVIVKMTPAAVRGVLAMMAGNPNPDG